MRAPGKIRVLVVDDSAVVRLLLCKHLGQAPDLEVVGTARDPYEARERILQLRPDVITLDVEMPKMGGIDFLGHLMQHRPMPVVVISSLTPRGSRIALEAMAAGATSVLCKPNASDAVPAFAAQLVGAVRKASSLGAGVRHLPAQQTPARVASICHVAPPHDQIVAIGASTGGTTATQAILQALPAGTPGIVITQHMPASFTRSYAERLDGLCALEVSEAREGDEVLPGRALIAPGDRHLLVRRAGGRFRVQLRRGPVVNRHRPSVDVLFRSVARCGGQAIGIILTGMGADGARGLLEMHQMGAWTVAQDEATCVVFGMPRVAIELGAVDQVLPLGMIAGRVAGRVEARARRGRDRLPLSAPWGDTDATSLSRDPD